MLPADSTNLMAASRPSPAGAAFFLPFALFLTTLRWPMVGFAAPHFGHFPDRGWYAVLHFSQLRVGAARFAFFFAIDSTFLGG